MVKKYECGVGVLHPPQKFQSRVVYTRVNNEGEPFLDKPLTTRRNFQDGWVENGNPTEKDLQLNSNTEEVKENVETR